MVIITSTPASEDFRELWMEIIFEGIVPPTVNKNLKICVNLFSLGYFNNLGQFVRDLDQLSVAIKQTREM